MNNPNIINEEINRFKLLMNYNSSKTLSENKELVQEQAGLFDDFIKAVTRVKKFFKYSDDFIEQLKAKSPAALRKFANDLLTTVGAKAEFPSLYKKAVDDFAQGVVNSTTNAEFKGLSDAAKKQRLISKGMSPDAADDVVKRMKELGGDSKLPAKTPDNLPAKPDNLPAKPVEISELPNTNKNITKYKLNDKIDDIEVVIHQAQKQGGWTRRRWLKVLAGIGITGIIAKAIYDGIKKDTPTAVAPVTPGDEGGTEGGTEGGAEGGTPGKGKINNPSWGRKIEVIGDYIYVPSEQGDPWEYRYNKTTKRWEAKKYFNPTWIDVDPSKGGKLVTADVAIRGRYDNMIKSYLEPTTPVTPNTPDTPPVQNPETGETEVENIDQNDEDFGKK